MKNYFFILPLIFSTISIFGQVSGNINYQTQIRYPENNINVRQPSNANIFINVKGLANIKADSYVAVFGVTQTGKTTEEVNSLIDERIKQAVDNFKTNEETEIFVDMISFVPIYEYNVEKKVFSKRTYSEIPSGFELKKNIHIKYSDPNLLNKIISTFSKAEIYDLVKVDYFSKSIEITKRELMIKAKSVLSEKMKNYGIILNVNLDTIEKHLSDGYRVVLPVEMYKSYQAYNSSSLNLKKSANVNDAEKATTLYYQPIVEKEFDFIINPIVIEPVIQVLYEINLTFNREKSTSKNGNKDYILITPSGDLKKLNIK